jgi:hypothetical protein
MATTYKSFLDDDIVSTKTLLHENIPVTGTIISSSTYGTGNIKPYAHGMFQSVYDYPYLSSSANHLFDMSVGLAANTPGSSSADSFVTKKVNLYNQMAQILVGFDATGSILKFDRDGDTATADAVEKFNSAFFLNFSRLLVKDEIKKGSFQLTLGINSSSASPFNATCLISDASASSGGGYKVNSPTGEYGVLYASNFSSASAGNSNDEVGLIFYQAGVAVISTAVFAQSSSNSVLTSMSGNQQGQLASGYVLQMAGTGSTYANVEALYGTGSISDAAAALRNRIRNVTFNNTTELNSTIHFCRVNHNDFNYSSNPTYLSSSQIRVKNKTTDAPVSYITTVGLYSPDNELLAVAKLSEPIKKDPTQELILRVRLDY